MMTPTAVIYNLDPFEESSVQYHQVGTIGMDDRGDVYRYVKVGGSNVAAGKSHTAPTQKTNHHNCAATAAVAANTSNKVTIQLGATAVVAQEYVGGYLVANDNSPEGEIYYVIDHPAADSGATLEVTVDRRFKTAITTSSEFTLVHNAFNGVIVAAASTIRATGSPIFDMTAAYFGWFKTRGVVAGLIGTAATLGADLKVEATGAYSDRTDALGASAEPVVAVADIAVGVATEYNPIRLVID